MPPKSTYAEKRLQRFAQNQAALPEEQRLANRSDLELESQKAIAHNTKYQQDAAKVWFQEFMQNCMPDQYEEKYFQNPGPTRYSPSVFKAYAVFLAQSRPGLINSKIAVSSILHMLGVLWGQMEKIRRCAFLKSEKDDVRNFVRTDLKEQEGLTTAMQMKPLATSEDTSYMFSVLYSPAYLATFHEMRIVFNITLFINLMVDAANRGGDMLDNPSCKEFPFVWKDIEIYALPLGDGVDFRAILTFRYLKGMKLDESKYKRIVVKTLSTCSSVEDSMRQLLILGLMDRVFDGDITSWEDLMTLRPPEAGALIQIKSSMKNLPVFRKMSIENTLSELPETHKRVQKEIRRIRHACHFQHRLTAFAWRRGVAYCLDANTTEENRKYLMGHMSNSDIFSHYQSKVSGVDLQAMYRGAEQEDLRLMLSISLNRKDDAPTRISAAGYQKALLDPDYVQAATDLAAVASALRADHGSVAAASKTLDPRFAEYRACASRRQALKETLIRKKFAEEYSEFFSESLCPRTPSESHTPTEDPLPEHQDQASTSDWSLLPKSSIPPAVSEKYFSSTVEDSLDAAVLDSVEEPPNFASAMQDFLQGGFEDGSDGPDGATTVLQLQSSASTSRLHGLPNKPLFPHMNKGASRYYVGSNVCDGFYEVLTAGSSEVDLARRAIQCFSTTHPIDTFYRGQEPVPGTFICPVCHISLSRIKKPGSDDKVVRSASSHVYQCFQRLALGKAQVDIDQRSHFSLPCQFQYIQADPLLASLKACGHIASSWTQFYHHIISHRKASERRLDINGASEKIWYCFFAGCAQDTSDRGKAGSSTSSLRADPRFDSADQLCSHLAAVHNVFVKSTSKADVHFCVYCETFIGPFDDPVAHIMSHKLDAVHLVKDSGYEAPTSGRLLRPDLCIFCYHDRNLPLHLRIVSKAVDTQGQHFHRHLSKIPEDTFTKCPAYPEMCTSDVEFSKDGLCEHLHETHGITTDNAARAPVKKKRPGSVILADKDANTAIRPSKSARKAAE